MTKIRYAKLVRDKIPDIIRNDKQIPTVQTLKPDEYRNELLYKLIEEAEELRRAGEYDEKNRAQMIEEIADVLEVLYAILKEFDLDEDEIEQTRIKKLKEKGGFEDRVFLESVIKN